MAVVDRAGRFRAKPFDIVVGEKGPNALLAVTVHFALTAELLQDGQYYDVSPEELSIIADFYLFKKDGGWNTYALDSLRSAFAWQAPDPFWLEDNLNTLRDQEVRLVVQMEEWEGRVRPKVKYLDPLEGDSSRPGVLEHADDAGRRALAAKYGTKFRAQFGQPHTPPTPAAPPGALPPPASAPEASAPPPGALPPPASAPEASAPPPGAPPSTTGAPPPAPTPATAAAPSPSPPPTSTPDAVWAAYLEIAVRAVDNPDSEEGHAHLTDKWFQIIAELFGDAAPARTDKFTPAEWGELLAKLPELVTPF